MGSIMKLRILGITLLIGIGHSLSWAEINEETRIQSPGFDHPHRVHQGFKPKPAGSSATTDAILQLTTAIQSARSLDKSKVRSSVIEADLQRMIKELEALRAREKGAAR